ncbi:succinate dehydrogenase, hydrophobic membrane anchor protein [Altererythrobacter sp.]|nr:succinate dehydrogenase, hydrophobic membrane anchor protein [Altererythrobacter sp.]
MSGGNKALVTQMRIAAVRAKVRGTGASGNGRRHWMVQRGTALVLLAALVWFVAELALRQPGTLAEARDWLGTPHVALFTALLIGAAAWHLQIGLSSIAADYVDGEGLRAGMVFASRIGLIVLVMAVWAALIILTYSAGDTM